MKKIKFIQILTVIFLTSIPLIPFSYAGPPAPWYFKDIADNSRGVAFGNGMYVAVGDKIMTSPDLFGWTTSLNPSQPLNGIAYGMNRFVAVGNNEVIYTSLDGSTWTLQSLGASATIDHHFNLIAVAYGNGKFIAVGNGVSPETKIFTSSDGITWDSFVPNSFNGNFVGITYGNGRFVAVGNGWFTGTQIKLIYFYSADNGTSWIPGEGPQSALNSIAYGNGKFVAVGPQGKFLSSADGTNWVIGDLMGFTQLPTAISYGNGYFVVIASGGEIRYSSDLSIWQSANTSANSLNAITYGIDTLFVAVGNGKFALSNFVGNQLVIHSNGAPGSGTVRSNPAGIDCASGTICTDFYDNNTIVTLKAVPHELTVSPNTRYYFNGWSGAECALNFSSTCKVKMDADKVVTANFSSTPPVSETWAKTFGGLDIDQINSISQTSDGGYIALGSTSSLTTGGPDLWVIKLNSVGAPDWQKTYGGPFFDAPGEIVQVQGGGYVVSGHSYTALRVLRLKENGDILWEYSYDDGTAAAQRGYSLKETADGGFIVAGDSDRYMSTFTDPLVLKINSDGSVAWKYVYYKPKTVAPLGGDHSVKSVQQTRDGGYILAGHTNYFGAGGYDAWVMKLNEDGTVAWENAYGGSGDDYAFAIQETWDGYYIMAGSTKSFGYNAFGGDDAWLVKLAYDGTVVWGKNYGGIAYENANSVWETSDGGYVLAGFTTSYAAGGHDAWVIKLRTDGTVIWDKAYGGSGQDNAYSIQETADGGFIVAGDSQLSGNTDALIMKLDSDGNLSGCAGIIINSNHLSDGLSATPTVTPGGVQRASFSLTNATSIPTPTVGTPPFSEVGVCTGSCSYPLNPTAQNNVPPSGGSPYSFDVLPSDNTCAWAVTSKPSWVTINSGGSGTGHGTVNYTIAANTGPARSGTMTIAGQTFTVNQDSGCTYVLTPATLSANFGTNGGIGSVSVATASTCGWMASFDLNGVAWINGTSSTGSCQYSPLGSNQLYSCVGPASISYGVSSNSGSSTSRTGTFSIANQTFTVNQGAVPLQTMAYPAGGTYSPPLQVRLVEVGLPADAIYYTTDGSNPTSSSNRQAYTTPITISDSTILKFYAAAGGQSEAVETENYTINPFQGGDISTPATSMMVNGPIPVTVKLDFGTAPVTTFTPDCISNTYFEVSGPDGLLSSLCRIRPAYGPNDVVTIGLDSTGHATFNLHCNLADMFDPSILSSLVPGTYTIQGTYSNYFKTNPNLSSGELLWTGAVPSQPITIRMYAYTFNGLFRPVKNPPTLNDARAGRTIPIKWRIADPNGWVSDPSSFVSLTSNMIDCKKVSTVLSSETPEAAAGFQGLKYLGKGKWRLRWQTPQSYAGQCRQINLTLKDGTKHKAYFKFANQDKDHDWDDDWPEDWHDDGSDDRHGD